MENFLLEPYTGDPLTYSQLCELVPDMPDDSEIPNEEVAEYFNFFVDPPLDIFHVKNRTWQFKDPEAATEHMAVAGWGNPNKTY